MDSLMNFEGHEVEVFEFNGQVLFNPYHVAECLEIKNIRDNLAGMNEKQVIKLTNSKVGITDFRKLHNTGENFLTESGVYKLIFKSRKPEAERFQDWVTDEVLPTIRKEGSYEIQEKEISQDSLKQIIKETIYQIVPEIFKQLEAKDKREKEAEEEMKRISIQVRNRIEYLLFSENYTYSEISKILEMEGHNILPSTICNYARHIGIY